MPIFIGFRFFFVFAVSLCRCCSHAFILFCISCDNNHYHFSMCDAQCLFLMLSMAVRSVRWKSIVNSLHVQHNATRCDDSKWVDRIWKPFFFGCTKIANILVCTRMIRIILWNFVMLNLCCFDSNSQCYTNVIYIICASICAIYG